MDPGDIVAHGTRKRRRLSESRAAQETECLLITHIRATDIAVRLRRIPIGFYVLVKSEDTSRRTLNVQATVNRDVFEWNEEIALPSDMSSLISFAVFASCEWGPAVGSDEILFQIQVSLGELIECNGRLESTRSWEMSDVETRSCLDMVIERRAHIERESENVRLGLGQMPLLVELSAGHQMLAHYRECEEEQILDEVIQHFESALRLSPPNGSNHDTVLFSIASARLMKFRTNEDAHGLDTAIDLYRRVLEIRLQDHPSYVLALLSLGVTLLARFQRGGTEENEREGRECLSKVLHTVQVDTYVYHAAFLACHSTASPELLQSLRDSRFMENDPIENVDDDDEDEDNEVERLDAILQWIFIPDCGTHDLLDHLGILFCVQLDHIGELISREEEISTLEVIVKSTSDSHPDKPSWLHYCSRSLWIRYEEIKDLNALERSISMECEAVRLLPDTDEDKPSWLSTLWKLLSARYKLLSDRLDMNQAILAIEEAIRLTPDDQQLDKAGWLSNLGDSLLTCYQHFGNLTDLDRSISLYEEALRIGPDGNQYKPGWLNALGDALCTRHANLGDLHDLERAISSHRDAFQLTADGHSDKLKSSNNLANSLFFRYDRLGNIGDLEDSISLNEEALQLAGGDLDKAGLLNELGRSLLARYERFGGLFKSETSDSGLLGRAIHMTEEAVQLTPKNDLNRPIRLNGLGSSLLTRYRRFGEVNDLKKSIASRQESVMLTRDGDPNKPVQLYNLGLSLGFRFERFGDVGDLQDAISFCEDAVRLTSDQHPNRPLLLDGLGNSLLARYEHFGLGDVADLRESILVLEDAVRLAHEDDPKKPAWLNNLSNALSTRHESFGDADDLERMISVQREAVRLTPDEHANKLTHASNLANAIAVRYERFGREADLVESISLHEEILRLCPVGHPYKAGWLNDLAVSLLKRFERSAEVNDVNMSISRYEESIGLISDDHPEKPGSLNNLGSSLFIRFRRFGNITDLERSISVTEQAMRFIGGMNSHPDRPKCLYTLASSLLTRFRRSESDSSSTDLTRAISYSSQAARIPTSPSADRFRASKLWIECVQSMEYEDNQALLDIYSLIVHLLPQLAWIGLPLHDRYHQLLRAADIVCDGAAVCLKANMPEQAIEWLEQGRSIVWSQLSQLRSPVDQLRVARPDLAGQFERMSRQLEHATISKDRSSAKQIASDTNAMKRSLEKQVERRHVLVTSRESLLVQIRALPGFQHFLLPKTIDQLASFAHTGPVVFLNASKYRCDALVVMASSERKVLHVPLPEVDYSAIKDMQVRLKKLLQINSRTTLRNASDLDVARGARLQDVTPDQVFGSVLPYLWGKVVRPVLDALKLSASSPTLPRIFWCPTGPFTSLPIHAAGYYGLDNPGPRLTDFAISSYVPSITMLGLPPQIEHFEPTSVIASSHIRLLGVRQPSTDGANHLQGVGKEMEVIETLASRSPFVKFEEAEGTVEDLLDKLQWSDWVHFACHGVQDRSDPLESGLLLAHGRRLRVSDLISEVGGLSLSPPSGHDRDRELPSHRGLAFLSACQTAMGDEKLTEESVHVAAGMLLAGFGSVVATMWSIMDRDAPQVAEWVYERLFFDSDRDGDEHEPREPGKLHGLDKLRAQPPDSREAAGALHHALERLRGSGVPYLSWVPFIHIGL